MADRYPQGFVKAHPLEYESWKAMKSRCFSKNAAHYHRYGGRGVTVCTAWLRFDAFVADMGSRPGTEYTLERINNDRGYEPGNCCWATYAEQANNRASNLPLMDRIGGGTCKWEPDHYPMLERPSLETRPLEALLGAGCGLERDPLYWAVV